MTREEISKNNEDKKKYLKQYIFAKNAAMRIEEQIEEVRTQEMFPSVFYSSIPSCNTKKDLSNYMSALDNLISELIKARYKKISIYMEIFKKIELIEDESERRVLTERYIHNNKWEKIACIIHVEWAQVHRIHGKALEHLEIE